MACFICDHTMQHAATAGKKDPFYWCPRCGSIKSFAKTVPEESPRLVSRVKIFLQKLTPHSELWDEAYRVGLFESVGENHGR